MDGLTGNPFAVLTLIVAPAILTNAASVLAMSTSNRFLRASERMRSLASRLHELTKRDPAWEMLFRQVNRVENQALLLLRALRSVYIALGAFAAASLVSILGAVLASIHVQGALYVVAVLALISGILGVCALIAASSNLFKATQLSLLNISEEAEFIRKEQATARVQEPPNS
jgi:hypothetical protein